MQIRPTIIIPLKPTQGTFWVIIGLLFLAWILIRADPSYKNEAESEREISLKYRRGAARPAAPTAPRTHNHLPSFNPYWTNTLPTGGQMRPVGLDIEPPIRRPVRNEAPATETG